jgi:hypothetical protein
MTPPAMAGGILLRYRLSGNSHPGSPKNLTLIRLRRRRVKIVGYGDSQCGVPEVPVIIPKQGMAQMLSAVV